jgi:DNA mismatch repair protein MutL
MLPLGGYHSFMPRIRRLDPSVVNQIAAGEVIERPASAVKELLENAIDALATRIVVDIAAGGTELIRVVDDGEGIHPDDLPLAVSSHATSKLTQAADLFHVSTFGFRGEALASLAEVSHLRLRSRPADQPHGCEIEVHHGRIGVPRECGCPCGTTVEVRHLFENVPVRRKFLKSVTTEFGQIAEQFTRVALAHPRLHLVLRHNEKTVYQLPPVDRPRDRLATFFGEEFTDQLIWVESEHAGHRLWGYVGHPSLSKSTRKTQYLYLNGRWIQDRTLQYALTEAYRGLVMTGRHPVAFLFLEMPCDQVDVNVHPTKAEVRFRDAQQLFRQLLAMIRSKFNSLDLHNRLTLPAAALRQSAEILPVNEPARPTHPLGVASWGPADAPHEVAAAVPDAAEPNQKMLPDEFAAWAKEQLARWTPESPLQFADAAAEGIHHARGPQADPQSTGNSSQSLGETAERDGAVVPADAAPSVPAHAAARVTATVPDRGQTSPLAAPPNASLVAASRPGVRALQIHDCYLVVETDAGLTVIDQHALHERILYEQLRRRVLAGAVESQQLLMPVPMTFTPREAATLIESAPLLERLGFGVEEFGKDTVLVTRHPVLPGRLELEPLVRDLAEKLESRPVVDRRDLLDELLHMMACKAAVKAGQRLSAEEIEALLQQRHLVDDAHHCPHGRPTALTLSRAELDRQFGRLG